jgi:hypothetical protein
MAAIGNSCCLASLFLDLRNASRLPPIQPFLGLRELGQLIDTSGSITASARRIPKIDAFVLDQKTPKDGLLIVGKRLIAVSWRHAIGLGKLPFNFNKSRSPR